MDPQNRRSAGPPITVATHLGPHLREDTEQAVVRFGEHLVAKRIAPEREIPFWLMWVRRFLAAPASGSPDDTIRAFLAVLEAEGRADWQLTQAERSVRFFLGGWREGSVAPSSRLTLDANGLCSDADAIAAVRELCRLRHYSPRTEQTYSDWIARFFRYQDRVGGQGASARHAVSGTVIRDYLSHLASSQGVAASTQNQAFNALLFLGREVLGLDLGDLSTTVRAKRGPKLPTVLSPAEVALVLNHLEGTLKLVAQLIYACVSGLHPRPLYVVWRLNGSIPPPQT